MKTCHKQAIKCVNGKEHTMLDLTADLEWCMDCGCVKDLSEPTETWIYPSGLPLGILKL